MKNLKLTAIALLTLFSAFVTSCSDDDSNPGVNPPPSGESFLVAIDTAKINVMRIDGTNETTIINRMENLNSYFSAVSISPDGSKMAYTNFQSTGTSPNVTYTREVRVADINGTNDHVVYTTNESGISFDALKFGADGKVFFKTETFAPTASTTLHLVNADGTGHEVIPGSFNLTDVSMNRNYYLVPSMSAAAVTIIDRNGDGGFGGMYHNESFTGIDQFAIGSGVFTTDDKYAVIPFKDGNNIKVRVIDIATKTSQTKTITPVTSTDWMNFHVSAGSTKGVLTITGGDYLKSKSFVFDITTGDTAAPFENNDNNVSNVYIRE